MPRRRRQQEHRKSSILTRLDLTLHVHQAFLYISLPPLHNYNVKMPNFMFLEDVDKQ